MTTIATHSPLNEAAIRATLDDIKDPCSCVAGAPAGLSEMGLIKDVQIIESEDGITVGVTLIATEPTCPFAMMFVSEAQQRIEAIPEVAAAVIEFQPDADWSELDASPSYRERLNAVRRQRGFNPLVFAGQAQEVVPNR